MYGPLFRGTFLRVRVRSNSYLSFSGSDPQRRHKVFTTPVVRGKERKWCYCSLVRGGCVAHLTEAVATATINHGTMTGREYGRKMSFSSCLPISCQCLPLTKSNWKPEDGSLDDVVYRLAFRGVGKTEKKSEWIW